MLDQWILCQGQGLNIVSTYRVCWRGNIFNSIQRLNPRRCELRGAEFKSKPAQCRESKRKSSTGHRISKELGGESRIEKKSLEHFLNEVTTRSSFAIFTLF